MKERNRLATETRERERLNAGHGEYESRERDRTVWHLVNRVTSRRLRLSLLYYLVIHFES